MRLILGIYKDKGKEYGNTMSLFFVDPTIPMMQTPMLHGSFPV